MSNTETEKPHSWLRTDRFTPINSSWLAENLKGVDQSVQDLLTMIEDDDYSLADADLVHVRRSDMFDCIKQIYHKHQILAEHYDQILSSDYSSLAITDHANVIALTTPNQDCQNQFDNASFPSNLSDGSSKIKFSLSESDSESDSSIEKYETPIMMPYPKSTNNNGSSRNDEYATVLNKITKYKEELKATQHKLQISEEEVIDLKRNERMALSELEDEKKMVAMMDCQITDCNMNIFKLVTELNYLREEVVKVNDELSNAREGFELEKEKLEMEALELSEVVYILGERNQIMELEAEYLRSEARELMRSKKLVEEEMKEEIAGKVSMIEDLYMKVEANEEKMKMAMRRREYDYEKRIGELEEKVEMSRKGEEELKKEVADRGEEKKEAIRQLCFSLDYYRNRNEKLRQVIVDANSKCYYYKSAAVVSAS
ncbi:protein NETWORKED 4B-like [Impatiens glandulifera]|uniref:protein NETWORKED 4B-like n=1 Tax=Impatiens glandulifera TaxID=253017 RepID=UPI001FB14042|nr:protein NETWORKED 4B-like [Impatiens glandulifera]